MIEPNHRKLSITRQCSPARVGRSSFYYGGKGEAALNLKLRRLMDEQWLRTPFFGSPAIYEGKAPAWAGKGCAV